MGKEKGKGNAAEECKEAGNKAFAERNFEQALASYSQAIVLSDENPSHVYFANRANARLELNDFNGCVEDCDAAINVEPKYIKAYLRKALAFKFLSKFSDALKAVQDGLKVEPDNTDLKTVAEQCNEEIKADAAVDQDDDQKKKYDAFLEWMDKGGCKYQKLRRRDHGDYLKKGLFAAGDIKRGDVVLQIPRQRMITMEDVLQTPVGKKLKEAGLCEPSVVTDNLKNLFHNHMATYLLQDIQKFKADNNYRGPFHEFYDMLPPHCDFFPSFFPDDLTEMLDGSEMQQHVMDRKQLNRQDYDFICARCPEFTQFSFHEYVYAVCLSQSYVYDINIDGTPSMAFVPMTNFFDHAYPRQTTFRYDSNLKSIVFEADEDIESGQPVNESYGQAPSNSFFFMNYGFVKYPYKHQDARINMYCREEDTPLFADKAALLVQHQNQFFRVQCNLSSDSMKMMLGFARWIAFDDASNKDVLAQNKAQVKQILQERNGVPPSQQLLDQNFTANLGPHNLANEVAAWQYVKKQCQYHLGLFKQTLAEDIQQLETEDMQKRESYSKRNILLYTRGEKEILTYIIEKADQVSELSKVSAKEAQQQVNKWEGFNHRHYFSTVFLKFLP